MLKMGRTFFLVTGLFLCLAGCDSNGGGEPGEAPANLLDSIDFSKQNVEILRAERLVSLSVLNGDQTKAVALLVPLESFYSGETVPLGADGLYGLNSREASVWVFDGLHVERETVIPQNIYISLEGSVKWNEVSLALDGKISGTLEISRLAPIHQNTGLIPRGKKYSFALNRDFAAIVRKGSTSAPIIFGFSPKEGHLGTKVVLKGLNLGRVTQVSSGDCSQPLSVPFEIVSDRELHVTLDQLGCKSRGPLRIDSPSSNGIKTGDSFQFEIPFVKMLEMNSSDPVIWDSFHDLVLFRRNWESKEFMIYSFAEELLVSSLYLDHGTYSMDTTMDESSLLLFRSSGDISPSLYDLERIGLENVLEAPSQMQLNNRWGNSISRGVVLGKGRKGFLEGSGSLGLLDINTLRTDPLPQSLSASFHSYNDSLLRSQNREYIVVNRFGRSFYNNPTVLYRSLDNGDFQKLASVNIDDAIFGIAEKSGEFWSETNVYNVNLENIGGYGADLTEWTETNAAGIVFDSEERYAILASKKGMLHIVDRASRATLASNIRITPLKDPKIKRGIFLSQDGTKVFLRGESQIYIVNVAGLLNSLGL